MNSGEYIFVSCCLLSREPCLRGPLKDHPLSFFVLQFPQILLWSSAQFKTRRLGYTAQKNVYMVY